MKEKIIFLALGAVGGSLITYFVMRHIHKKKEEEIWNKAFAECKTYRESREEEKEEHIESLVRSYSGQVVEHTEDELAEMESPPEDEPEEDEEDESNQGPYVIPEIFFYGEVLNDKIDVLYYEADDTLAYENGDIIKDIAGTIGEDCLTRFGFETIDDDVVFVRNPRLGADFMVTRIPGSYEEIVMGFVNYEADSDDDLPM